MSEPNTLMVNDVRFVREDSIPKQVSYTPTKNGAWETGKRYLVRTVTMILHGLLVGIDDKELVLTQAAWIADTGRFSNFVCGTGDPNEVEPFPQDKLVIVGRGALIDAVEIDRIFKIQK